MAEADMIAHDTGVKAPALPSARRAMPGAALPMAATRPAVARVGIGLATPIQGTGR